MNRIRRPTSPGWTIVVVSAAALLLASCGRKGPLELPPNSPPAPALSAAPTDSAAEAAKQPTIFGSSYGSDAPPSAPRGAKRPFVLDPLLDSK